MREGETEIERRRTVKDERRGDRDREKEESKG